MSYSFNPFLLSQWNLFPSAFLRAGKLSLPLISLVDTERLAVLSRRPVAPQTEPPTSFSATSISGFFSDGFFVDVSVRWQAVLLLVRGSSRATTLEGPGVWPLMFGSEEVVCAD